MPKWFSDHRFLLIAILLLAFVVRLYRITNPIADWHAFRQADTASVTREYVKHGVDWLRPRYQDLSNIQSGEPNPEGYRMVEFPLINGLTAHLLRAFPVLPFDLTNRLLSVAASIGTLYCLYKLVEVLSGRKVATVTAFIFAILPYSIYYSRVVLPEPWMLFFSTLSLWQFHRWTQNRSWIAYAVSVVGLAAALLLKPYVLFLGPVFAMLALTAFKWQVWKRWELVPYVLLAVAPLYGWREWIQQFPEGIPYSAWLYNINGIRLRPAWFRWLFWERLTKLFAGFALVIALVMNFKKIDKAALIYGSWWIGIVAFFVVFATGNVQHDYYQNLMLPIFCISVGRGLTLLYDWSSRRFTQGIALVLCLVLLSTGWYFAWKQTKGYFDVNHWEYLRAGAAVDQLTPADAKVIAPAFGDTHFLYQTNRTGWPIGFDIPQKIEAGATHYVTTSMDDEARELLRSYSVVAQTTEYLILDLRQPKSL